MFIMEPVWQVANLICLGLQRVPGTWDFDLLLPVYLVVNIDSRALIVTDSLGGVRNQPEESYFVPFGTCSTLD